MTAHLENRFFHYNTTHIALERVLQEFSSVDMNEGKDKMLAHYQYTEIPGGQPPITYYKSTFAQAQYLAIAEVGGYRLIVFVSDEASLLAFRQKYGFAGSLLPQMLLPSKEPPPDNTQYIKLNMRSLRGS